MIAATPANNHTSIAAMWTYVSALLSGTANPFWPHLVLLSASVVAGIAVGAGIIFESAEYSASIRRTATLLVIVGVIIESICTVSLFVVDEEISHRQTEELLQVRRQTANRDITPKEIEAAASRLAKFSGQPAKIVVFPVNSETIWVAFEIYGILLNAHWNVLPPDRLSVPPGGFMASGIFIETSIDDASREAATALREALDSTESQASSSLGKSISGAFDAAKPLVWILVGDKPMPLRSWVIP